MRHEFFSKRACQIKRTKNISARQMKEAWNFTKDFSLSAFARTG
jgi:hypothetical protein